MIQLETSTACDARCVFCPHKDLKRHGGSMKEELFVSIIDQAADLGIPEVLLFLNGEPLLFPKLFTWLELLRDRGLITAIFTNAASLTAEKSERLMGFSDVIRVICFSLGGFDRETYRAVMGLDYETVYANVTRFLEVNDGAIPVEAHIPLMSKTVGFMDKWRERWGPLLLSAPTDMFNFAGLVSDELELRESDRHKKGKCGRLDHLTVLWNGEVCLCCMDAEGQVILGNLNQQSIMEAFNSETAVYYRTLHETGRFDELPLCKNCNMNMVGIT